MVSLSCAIPASPPRSLPSRAEPKQANSGKPDSSAGVRCGSGSTTGRLAVPVWFHTPERSWGPILFTQYTIAAGVLKLTVQLAPMEGDEPPVELRVKGKPARQRRDRAVLEHRTVPHHRLERKQRRPLRDGFSRPQTTPASSARDPKRKNEIVVGSLTCQGDFGFPHAEILRNVQIARPDLLLFTGDQLYEANGGYGIQRNANRSCAP